LIFQRGDFVGGSVFEVNCDRHGFVYLEFRLFGTVSISSVWKKGGKGEDHFVASLSW
jgi:hypothetical protein